MHNRAYRRHQAERMKQRVLQWLRHGLWIWHEEPSVEAVGIRANTPAICSCLMCRNPQVFIRYKALRLSHREIKRMAFH